MLEYFQPNSPYSPYLLRGHSDPRVFSSPIQITRAHVWDRHINSKVFDLFCGFLHQTISQFVCRPA